ncbi:MAG TPA: long-chain fatty acid--CoA ligase [Streptosporangiaceae bacterium]|nr:long-chain fatty acid--CoA ligase [Streptosporangiaceae bacterium]
MKEQQSRALTVVPDSANLTEIIFDRAERSPDTVIMRRKAGGGTDGNWQDVTAAEFQREVAGVAKGLIAAGIQIGDRVALMSRTRYEWTLADYAIWAAGAVAVPVYETSSAEQVEWILSDSGARCMILESAAHAEAAAGVLAGLDRAWLIEGDTHGAGASEVAAKPLDSLADEGASISDSQLDERRKSASSADLATIIYTSGTTGRPKGCRLTHGNLLSDVHGAIDAMPEIFAGSTGSALLFLPLAHSFARIIEVGCLEAGTVLGHTPNMADVRPDLESFHPVFILAVPRVFEKVYNGAELQASESKLKARIFRAAAQVALEWSKTLGDTGQPAPGSQSLRLRLSHSLFDRLVYSKLREATGGRVQYAVSGGAPLGERLGHFFRGVGITILEGYGLTETSAAATANRPERNKIGTVGMPLPGVGVRIAEDGEILISGPNVFDGYWQNETATSEMIDADGWLHTGDLGELDEDGFLKVTGRKKDIIVTAGGKNVAPAVLEDRLRAHPLISQCMVVGDGRPYIAVLITLDEEALEAWKSKRPRLASASTAELATDSELVAEIQAAVDEANKAVSRPESIRRFRILDSDFTEHGGHLTPSLKVKRSVVAKDFAADIDALYS